MTFNEYFGSPEVISFSEGWEVVSREHYSKAEALVIFRKGLGDEILESDIKEDWVQYGFGEDSDFDDRRAWWLKGSAGRNRKKVWVINKWIRSITN